LQLHPEFDDNGALVSLDADTGAGNLILPWGTEVADPSGFFTSTDTSWRVDVQRRVDAHESACESEYEIAFSSERKITVRVNESVSPDAVQREHSLTTQTRVDLADFVARYQFSLDSFSRASIGPEEIEHTGLGLYHMHKVDSVVLHGSGISVDISGNYSGTDDSFEMYAYVSDPPGKWVVHFRMLPRVWDYELVKIAKAWAGTRPLPRPLSAVLLAIPKFRARFWFGPERRKPRKLWRYLNPIVFPYKRLSPGYSMIIRTSAKFALRGPD
jgi:hypothetical protein